MNYNKRKSEVCRECPIEDNCLYITRGLSDKCERNQLIMEGWEKGWQDAIDKACEWLKFNYVEFTDNSRLGLNINELIKDFKKDIEEQQ